jgi:hypothetical protein
MARGIIAIITRKDGEASHPIPRHPTLHGTPAAPEDVAGHDCIIYEGFQAPDVWTFARGQADMAITIRPRGLIAEKGCRFAVGKWAECGAAPRPISRVDFRSLYARRPAFEGVERTGREKSNRRNDRSLEVSLSVQVRGRVSRPYSPGRGVSRPSFFASPCLGVPLP